MIILNIRSSAPCFCNLWGLASSRGNRAVIFGAEIIIRIRQGVSRVCMIVKKD